MPPLLTKEGPDMDRAEFRLLRDFINDFCGIALADETRVVTERKLRDRLLSLHLNSFGEYYHYLRYHPERRNELERAVDLLTTNETYFFRELVQLNAFSREVLPNMKASCSERRSLTVWSAGCSTGEEVYTIAILIHRSGLFKDWNVRVFGNDIARRVLQKARKGVFSESSFRAMPREYACHFSKTPEGSVVDPEIRAMCHFGHFNLLDKARVAIVGRVDAIFCRNVLIYFDQESRRKVISTFHERLHPKGYLMLGHSESLLHTSTAFELAHLKGDLAYRRAAEPAATTGPSKKRSPR